MAGKTVQYHVCDSDWKTLARQIELAENRRPALCHIGSVAARHADSWQHLDDSTYLKKYPMQMPSFEEFKATSLAAGYDEVLIREWPANQEIGLHDHPFAVTALVVEGEMWLTLKGQTRHLQPGDRFEVTLREQHAERYGPQGSTFWVARRNA